MDADTTKLTGPQTFSGKNWVGLIKNQVALVTSSDKNLKNFSTFLIFGLVNFW